MSDPTERSVPEAAAPMSSAALARRHLLLKSLGKGSVALAATAIPIRTLAVTPTLRVDGKEVRCSISGMQSVAPSRMTDTVACTGKSPGYWHKYEHWTAGQKMAAMTPFEVLFLSVGSAGSLGRYTLYDFVCSIGGVKPGGGDKDDKGNKPKAPGTTDAPTFTPGVENMQLNATDEWHWCCAWMNAMANGVPGTGVQYFPYTPLEVTALYRGPNRAGALQFFKLLEM